MDKRRCATRDVGVEQSALIRLVVAIVQAHAEPARCSQLFQVVPQCVVDRYLRELEGPLHSVRVAHSGLIRPAEFKAVNGVMTLH